MSCQNRYQDRPQIQRLHLWAWREAHVSQNCGIEDTAEEHLCLLEQQLEDGGSEGSLDGTEKLGKMADDEKIRMAVADGLDEIRARIARWDGIGRRRHYENIAIPEMQEDGQQDSELARRAFASAVEETEEPLDLAPSSEELFKPKRRSGRPKVASGGEKTALNC